MKMTLLTNERGHDARARRPAVQPALQFYKQLELCDTQSASFGLHFGRDANWRIGRSNLANWTTTPRRLAATDDGVRRRRRFLLLMDDSAAVR